MSVKLCYTNIISDLRLGNICVHLQPMIICRSRHSVVIALHFCKKYLIAVKFATLVLFLLKY